MPVHKIGLEQAEYEDRYVCLIDILGFSKAVNSKAFKEINSIFDDFKDDVSDGEVVINVDEENHQKILRGEKYTGGKGFKPAFSIFSDTILFSIPKIALVSFPEERNLPIPSEVMHINQISFFVRRIQMSLLQNGYLSRGALTYGPVYSKGNNWFGPALVEAAYLEKEISIYPRVVISKRIIQWLKGILDEGRVNLKDLARDSDGNYFFNYSLLYASSPEERKEIFEKLKNIATANLDTDNTRILAKWEWLLDKLEKSNSEIN